MYKIFYDNFTAMKILIINELKCSSFYKKNQNSFFFIKAHKSWFLVFLYKLVKIFKN